MINREWSILRDEVLSKEEWPLEATA